MGLATLPPVGDADGLAGEPVGEATGDADGLAVAVGVGVEAGRFGGSGLFSHAPRTARAASIVDKIIDLLIVSPCQGQKLRARAVIKLGRTPSAAQTSNSRTDT